MKGKGSRYLIKATFAVLELVKLWSLVTVVTTCQIQDKMTEKVNLLQLNLHLVNELKWLFIYSQRALCVNLMIAFRVYCVRMFYIF